MLASMFVGAAGFFIVFIANAGNNGIISLSSVRRERERETEREGGREEGEERGRGGGREREGERCDVLLLIQLNVLVFTFRMVDLLTS